ncbi:MAG: ABC transporter ATP-binding protein [Methermicoccaceae archaeon]
MDEHRLDVEGIECHYGAMRVLSDVSIGSSSGEVVGIIGPNGSGKSTLIKAMSRLLKPTQGTVLIDGNEVYEMGITDVAKKMAVVSQDEASHFDFTVFDIVLMGRTPHMGRLSGESESDIEIAMSALKETNTLHLKDRLITELSGGERQRVMIARALTQQPRFLLLDEPTSHLDINHQIEILSLVRRLAKQKRLIVVVVLHDLSMATFVCDRLVLLKSGRVVAMGTPEEVITEKNIRDVFDVRVVVRRSPISSTLYVLPCPHPPDQRAERVHVVCGGGSGQRLLTSLYEHGYRVSVGVLNEGETDHEVCTLLSLPCITVPPFSPLTQEAVERAKEMMLDANAVVVSSVPFGWGNIANLKAVLEVCESVPVLLVSDVPVHERDFIGGDADKLYRTLLERGAVQVREDEVLRTLSELI